ncbi:hypothetical protein [Stenotrophomonas sp. BR163]|uniref:hypothetical protein n=1 Tax=Stenotrophomonas sp. BR163 TaxID=3398459 RepID=UPI0039C75F0E
MRQDDPDRFVPTTRPQGGIDRMILEAVERELQACPSVAAKGAWVRAHVGTWAKSKIARDDLDRLHRLLKDNRRPQALALGLALAMVGGGNSLVAELRRRGHLRASRYHFRVGAVRELVSVLGELHGVLGLEDRWRDYLMSVDALYQLAPDARRLRDGLMTRLSGRRGRAIKSFLVLADQTFAQGGVPLIEPGSSPVTTAEELASAVSRIIALAREEGGLRPLDLALTDEQTLNPFNGTYNLDLHCAHRLEELCRAETMIDGLPYRARLVKDCVTVSSIDPDVEKSVRLGYVQRNMQVHMRQHEMRHLWGQELEAPLSIVEVFKLYYDDVISRFVQIKTFPLSRIAFSIPDIPNLFAPLADERLFREELFFLAQLSVEDYGNFRLEPFEVAPGILSIDLFKVMRFFALMAYLYQRELEQVTDLVERQRLTFHSVIVQMRREQLLQLLGTVLSGDKAERILDMLVLDEARDLVDLQYSPFLKIGDYYHLAPSLIARSNLVRNIALLNGLNATRLDGEDPMQSAVAEALREAGFQVGEEVENSKRSATGDTDLVAYRDGVLYLFECKNAYHPCNAHEMRNSYDHIVKAGRQLMLREKRFGEREYRERVWKKLGWTVPAPTTIRTAVLIANRVFTGISIEGHPVRQAHEFINVVVRGEIRSLDATYRLWDGDVLSTADLDRYLGGDGLIGDHFASLDPHDDSLDFGQRKLGFESWKFNALKHNQIIRKRYHLRLDHTLYTVSNPR